MDAPGFTNADLWEATEGKSAHPAISVAASQSGFVLMKKPPISSPTTPPR
jgi:hypothetical protein